MDIRGYISLASFFLFGIILVMSGGELGIDGIKIVGVIIVLSSLMVMIIFVLFNRE